MASINAYLGAFPLAAALDGGADIVITGRCVDSAVTLAACIHAFGWRREDLDHLAQDSELQGIVAGAAARLLGRPVRVRYRAGNGAEEPEETPAELLDGRRRLAARGSQLRQLANERAVRDAILAADAEEDQGADAECGDGSDLTSVG